MDSERPSDAPPREPKWKPLAAMDRRLVGVLVEKAKTTPDQYPLTLNAIRTGANQKSNRFPQFQLEVEQVEEALDRLRQVGAVVEVQGSGRVPKYRHQMYEWLNVDKVELAVMAELLLRGAQTIGELRGRAARMEPIADLGALRPCLASLNDKGLLHYLTPEGRGCVLTHALYLPQELAKLRAEYATHRSDDPSARAPIAEPSGAVSSPPIRADVPSSLPSEPERIGATQDELIGLRRDVESLRSQIDELRGQIDELCRQVDAGRTPEFNESERE